MLKDGIKEWRRGTLLAWGTDYEELRDSVGLHPVGVGLYPVGVIEDGKTSAVHSVPVHLLNFSDVRPSAE